MNPRPSPTTADLAAQLGLAATTVAAALRGETRISAQTRERVARAAAELGYRRNIAASVLGSRRQAGARSPTLSAAFLVRLRGTAGTPYESSLRLAFTAAGWLFRTVNLMNVRDPAALGRRLDAEGVDGLVLGPTSPTDLALPPLPWQSFALISVIRQRVSDGFDTARVNHFGSVLRLVDEIVSRGYRRIGVLHRPHTPALEEDDARLAAFLLARHRHSRGAVRVFLHHLPFREETTDEPARDSALKRWLDRTRPDVVIGFNSADRHLLQAAGRRVPSDLAFAAVHVYQKQTPNCAGLRSPAELIADLARIRLEQKVRLGERGLSTRPVESVLTPEFIAGASLPELQA